MAEQRASQLLLEVLCENPEIAKNVNNMDYVRRLIRIYPFSPDLDRLINNAVAKPNETDEETFVQLGKLLLPKAKELYLTQESEYPGNPHISYSGGFFAPYHAPGADELRYTLWTSIPTISISEGYDENGNKKDIKLVHTEKYSQKDHHFLHDNRIHWFAKDILQREIKSEEIEEREVQTYKSMNYNRYFITKRVRLK